MIRKIESFSEKSVRRRDFVKKGAVGVSAAVLSTSGTALAQVSPAQAIPWNYEADIVIIGGGCTGLPAAIRARDLGASVIIVDRNCSHSSRPVSFGRFSPPSRRRADVPARQSPTSPFALRDHLFDRASERKVTAASIDAAALEPAPDRKSADSNAWGHLAQAGRPSRGILRAGGHMRVLLAALLFAGPARPYMQILIRRSGVKL